MKKVMSVFLCTAVLICTLFINTNAQITDAENILSEQVSVEQGKIYYLKTTDDLIALARIVNEDKNSCERVSFRLTNDITV
ncbi:MAG: hypothetical protein IJU45_07145, partial [Clostridia bacterium]|nr:hypothetical protein [Clostridia bacterium]